MSGLTLGLMSLGLVDLEVLRRSGSEQEKKQAGKWSQRHFSEVSRRLHFQDHVRPLIQTEDEEGEHT